MQGDVELLTQTLLSGDKLPYERALAATALGHELVTSDAALIKGQSIEDALLELVGYA